MTNGSHSLYTSTMFAEWLFARHVDDDEEISLIVHKHWLLGVQHLFWPGAAFLGVWGFFAFAPFPVIFYMASIASVAVVVWAMRNFFDYFLDAWIITDQGIIDVEWHGWFHR